MLYRDKTQTSSYLLDSGWKKSTNIHLLGKWLASYNSERMHKNLLAIAFIILCLYIKLVRRSRFIRR